MPQRIFQVKRKDFTQKRFTETPGYEAAGTGELLVRIRRFALTANNITYALYGDMLGYWQFYPQSGGWGVIPCWGFAEVVDSGCADVDAGEILFGYWPMADVDRLTPKQIDAGNIIEGADCRQSLNPFYNRYARLGKQPGLSPEDEGWQSIFRPLGMTGFMLDDYVHAEQAWGAERVLLASASSKTALATAHCLKQRGANRVVGCTSAQNADFTSGFGVYDDVLQYDAITALDDTPTVYIDMAGNLAVTRSVHDHLGDSLKKSILVGGTHWQDAGQHSDLSGPEPEFFFAPDHIVKRFAEWGEAEFGKRFEAAWTSLMPAMQAGLTLEMHRGQADLQAGYADLLAGKNRPDIGYIFEL